MPAIKPAAALTRNGCIGLLATPGTVSRAYTHELIAQFAPGKRVFAQGATELVIEAERKLAGLPVNMALLREVLVDWIEGEERPDTLVLGCTHFPLLNEEIRQLMPECQLVDSGCAVARRVAHLLTAIPSSSPTRGQVLPTAAGWMPRPKTDSPLQAWGAVITGRGRMLISQASTSFPSFSSLSRLSLASRTFQSALLILLVVERGDGLGRIGDGHLHKPKALRLPVALSFIRRTEITWPCSAKSSRTAISLAR